jgi:hypothetical protein
LSSATKDQAKNIGEMTENNEYLEKQMHWKFDPCEETLQRKDMFEFVDYNSTEYRKLAINKMLKNFFKKDLAVHLRKKKMRT